MYQIPEPDVEGRQAFLLCQLYGYNLLNENPEAKPNISSLVLKELALRQLTIGP